MAINEDDNNERIARRAVIDWHWQLEAKRWRHISHAVTGQLDRTQAERDRAERQVAEEQARNVDLRLLLVLFGVPGATVLLGLIMVVIYLARGGAW